MGSLTKGKPLAAISLITVATELHAIQTEQKRLKEREEELRAALFDSLKSQGVASVKLKDGTQYVVAKRHSLEPLQTMKEQAWKWAVEHNALKLDTSKAFKILRHQLDTPKFFRIKMTEYLVVRRPGAVNDNHHNSE
jgi:hypothetical protein